MVGSACASFKDSSWNPQCLFQAVLVILLKPTAETDATGGSTSTLTSTSSSDWPLRRSFASSDRLNAHEHTRVCTHTQFTHLPILLWSCGFGGFDQKHLFFVFHIILFHHVELFNLEGFLQCKVFIHIHSIHNKIYFSSSALQWHVFKISQE